MDDLLPKKRRHFKAPVEAISNGVDLSKFGKKKVSGRLYRKYRVDPNKKTLLYVGRVDPEKSLNVLMEAFARVHRNNPDTQLLIVGDGTDKSRLETDANELGIRDSVIFAGRVIGRDLPVLYNMGDVFGITSTTETQSIVVLEAMASGLPVIAVRAGALEELVTTNRNGFLCEPKNVREVASSFDFILSNPEKAREMGAESRKIAKTHDLSHTLNRMEEIYKEVIKNHEESLREDDED